jgi:hypothetical protein
MNKPKRECGSCANWFKIKKTPFDGRGLCEFLDIVPKAQHKVNCPHWKGKKYQRQRHDYINDETLS